jgi:hypothetical protein
MEGLTMVAQMLHPANILRSYVLPRGEKLRQKASRLSRRRYFGSRNRYFRNGYFRSRSRLARLVSSYPSTSSRSFSRGWASCLTAGALGSIDINIRKGELPASLLYNVRYEA